MNKPLTRQTATRRHPHALTACSGLSASAPWRVLANFEKSKLLAQMFIENGTFGYVPGHPTAYTQPLYGFFLIPIFWIAGFHWWSFGTVQILVAVATSLCVLEIGRRFLSLRIGLLAAVIATLQPYLVWHDIHGNREILDQLIGAALFGLTLLAASRRSVWTGVGLGIVAGLGVLSNARLTLLPLILARVHPLARRRLGGRDRGAARRRGHGQPVGRPQQGRARLLRDHDRRPCALEGKQREHLQDALERPLARPGARPPAAAREADPADVGDTRDGWCRVAREPPVIVVPECAQQSAYEHLVFKFWKHHPGEKVKLAGQATEMLWSPRAGLEGAQEAGVDSLRQWAEPLYTVPLFLLAIAGLFCVPAAFRALAIIFVLYETAAAWVFAGTTRYRVPWDFVLALLAAAALDRAWTWLRSRKQAVGPVVDGVAGHDAGT